MNGNGVLAAWTEEEVGGLDGRGKRKVMMQRYCLYMAFYV